MEEGFFPLLRHVKATTLIPSTLFSTELPNPLQIQYFTQRRLLSVNPRKSSKRFGNYRRILRTILKQSPTRQIINMTSLKKLCSAIIIQIIMNHINISSCYYPLPGKSSQNSGVNMDFFKIYSLCKEIDCNKQSPTDQELMFHRNAKSGKQPRMLTIDLSTLRPRSTKLPSGTRSKAPINLLGVDISVLSQNPDTNLPVAQTEFDNIKNEKTILDNFDPKYDRLPVIEAKHINNYFTPQQFTNTRNSLLYPFQHLPLNIMTTYHFITKNKKQGRNLMLTTDNQRINDDEKNYTANFILHLLYQLSSNYQGNMY
ncbi:uncharacterized protein CDAR_247401 [Caerostris darwini]|uniref:Uncharacterized protein n=1 Tax=Caerostris darwini TaxID=1538125 RepID=A0AAV4ME53_9ARAC|nr:uncharacterized protein CDAR_247401 [Caerostris darwini]